MSTSRTAPSAAKSSGTPSASWIPPQPLGRRGRIIIAAIILVINIPLIHYFVIRRPMAPVTTIPYSDDFSNPTSLRSNYFSTGGFPRIINGELLIPDNTRNNPLWLQAALPDNVAIDFDVRSMSEAGDIKVEIFGDGTDHASGYVLIHGGWNNSLSIIARLDEHAPSLTKLLADRKPFGPDSRVRVEANPYPVQPGRAYHWRIERRGGLLTWFIDGAKFMEFNDPYPLKGSGNDRFAFSSWGSDLYFDNLRITPL